MDLDELYMEGLDLFADEDYRGAVAAFRQVTDRDPTYVDAWHGIARASFEARESGPGLLDEAILAATKIVESSIKVNLPDAATGEATESTSLGLTLTDAGDLLLDGEVIDKEGLQIKIREAKAANAEVICLIAADKDVSHGRVVWLIDLVKSEGIAKFALNIDKSNAVGPDPAKVDIETVDGAGG